MSGRGGGRGTSPRGRGRRSARRAPRAGSAWRAPSPGGRRAYLTCVYTAGVVVAGGGWGDRRGRGGGRRRPGLGRRSGSCRHRHRRRRLGSERSRFCVVAGARGHRLRRRRRSERDCRRGGRPGGCGRGVALSRGSRLVEDVVVHPSPHVVHVGYERGSWKSWGGEYRIADSMKSFQIWVGKRPGRGSVHVQHGISPSDSRSRRSRGWGLAAEPRVRVVLGRAGLAGGGAPEVRAGARPARDVLAQGSASPWRRPRPGSRASAPACPSASRSRRLAGRRAGSPSVSSRSRPRRASRTPKPSRAARRRSSRARSTAPAAAACARRACAPCWRRSALRPAA